MAYVRKTEDRLDCSMCKHHHCSNICLINSKLCNGHCLLNNQFRICDRKHNCKKYKYDEMFEKIKGKYGL